MYTLFNGLIILTGVLKKPSVKVTLHTEFSVSPPEFSIICFTEGGPATYVTWFGPTGNLVQEDSDHEISQIIVDTSYNSVYENRLQVRGRESGIYTCIVSNNRPDFFPQTLSIVDKSEHIMGL